MCSDPAYLSNEEDRRLLVSGLDTARHAIRQARIASPGSCPVLMEALPGPLLLYTALDSLGLFYSSLYTTSFFHMSGTCRMQTNRGSLPNKSHPNDDNCPGIADEDSVVDINLRVRGVTHLRVADSSIFPRIPSCPTAATSMAVGRRAAELVIEAEQMS